MDAPLDWGDLAGALLPLNGFQNGLDQNKVLMTKVNAGILGTGHSYPEVVLTNADLEKMVETSDEWITSRTGIKQRHKAAPGEYTSQFAVRASQEAIERAGLPRADFFMDFVDYEHCLRLRHHGFSIALVRDSILDHAIGTSQDVNFFGRIRFWADHVPWREYYMARNETFTMWQYSPRLATKIFVLHRLAQHAMGILLFGKNKVSCLRMMCRGFLDGRAGRLGIRFGPERTDPQSTGSIRAEKKVFKPGV